jgi:hypothetical protein
VTGRPMRINQSTADYFAVGDDPALSYEERLEQYRRLADSYFQTDAFHEFCAEAIPHLGEVTVDYLESPEFDELTVRTITEDVLEPEQHDTLIERSRTNVAAWIADYRATG